MVGGKFIINPSSEEMVESKLNLLLAGTEDAILMIEGACNFLTEEEVLEFITKANHPAAALEPMF